MRKTTFLHQLHKSQLFKQYFRRVLLFFSIPCLLFSVILYSYYRMHNETIVKSAFLSTVNHTVQTLNNTFDEIHKKYYLINSDRTIKNNMFLNDKNFFLPENQASVSYINSLLSYTLDTSNIIDSIYLYSINNKYVYTVDKTLSVSSNHFNAFEDKQWFKAYEQNPCPQLIIGEYNDCYKTNIVSVIYQMYSGNVTTGILVFNISESSLKNMLIPDSNTSGSNIIIKNEDNYIFSAIDDDIDTLTENSSRANYYSGSLDFPGITLTVISERNNTNVFSIFLLAVFILFFAVIIPVVLSLVLSNSFYKSIYGIVSNFLELFPQETDINNEIDFIQNHIKEIVHTSQDLERSVAHYIQETQQSQLLSLQLQLNPHFLFNTLNALSLMNSTDANKDEFELLVRNLSNLLSYSLDTRNDIVTIRDEIEYSKYFIEMEEIKYHSKINVTFDISKNMLNDLLPKFIFQPILENSFKHGFKYMFDDNKNIIVSAKKSNNILTLKFKDNGIGISDSDVKEINLLLSDGYFPQSQHIGLYNVNKRIQLLYGKSFGCKIYSSDNCGTTVIIRLPSNHLK